jgi:hypothetical protein
MNGILICNGTKTTYKILKFEMCSSNSHMSNQIYLEILPFCIFHTLCMRSSIMFFSPFF